MARSDKKKKKAVEPKKSLGERLKGLAIGLIIVAGCLAVLAGIATAVMLFM